MASESLRPWTSHVAEDAALAGTSSSAVGGIGLGPSCSGHWEPLTVMFGRKASGGMAFGFKGKMPRALKPDTIFSFVIAAFQALENKLQKLLFDTTTPGKLVIKF